MAHDCQVHLAAEDYDNCDTYYPLAFVHKVHKIYNMSSIMRGHKNALCNVFKFLGSNYFAAGVSNLPSDYGYSAMTLVIESAQTLK